MQRNINIRPTTNLKGPKQSLVGVLQQRLSCSSDWSPQSSTPSHTQDGLTHTWLVHWNMWWGHQRPPGNRVAEGDTTQVTAHFHFQFSFVSNFHSHLKLNIPECISQQLAALLGGCSVYMKHSDGHTERRDLQD